MTKHWLCVLGRTPFSLDSILRCLSLQWLLCTWPSSATAATSTMSSYSLPAYPASLFSPMLPVLLVLWQKSLVISPEPRIDFTSYPPSLILAPTSHGSKTNHDGFPLRGSYAFLSSDRKCKFAWNVLQLALDEIHATVSPSQESLLSPTPTPLPQATFSAWQSLSAANYVPLW